MPRKARKLSRTNIYHVMLRGINRQTIFEDPEDRYVFLTEIRRCKEISDFRLYAFCLMPNHIHLLMETNLEPLDMIFRRIGSRYVGWYNRKYERVGHLFQDRFRSENVETEQYFLTVLRYILQNPMKAGLEEKPGTYRWSSYLAYEKGAGSITDTQFAVDMVGQRETLINFICEANEDNPMDMGDYDWRLTDEQARQRMEHLTGCSNVSDFQHLEHDAQKEFILRMHDERMSVRQISRLTGKSRKLIDKYVKQDDSRLLEDPFQLQINRILEQEPDISLRESGFDELIIW